MHIAERLLLYATAVCAGALLLFGENRNSQSSGAVERDPLSAKQPPDSPLPTAGKSEIVLHDQLGRARIVIKVADDGRPSVVLKGDAGQDALSLAAENSGSARVLIGSPGRHAELRLDAQGNAGLELLNGEQGRVLVSCARDGSTSVSLSGEVGLPVATLMRDLHGNAELKLGSAENRPAMTFTATRAGELLGEFLGAGSSRAQLALTDSGVAELTLSGGGGNAGVLRAGKNGTTELSIRGTGKGTIVLRADGSQLPRLEIVDSAGKALVSLPSGTAGAN